jgi:hypothetical protein
LIVDVVCLIVVGAFFAPLIAMAARGAKES